MNKKEHIFSNILFFFGLILLIFACTALIYQIIHTSTYDWSSVDPSEYKATRNYLIVEFFTIAFKLVVSSYAIYCSKHLDEALNPLFTFTCLYLVFVVLQSILFFSNGGTDLGLVVTINASIDMVVSVLFFGITFFLKLDDWKSEE